MLEKIRSTISEVTKIPRSKITDNANLIDLVSESFVMVELMLAVQEDLEVMLSSDDLINVSTVKELSMLIDKKTLEKS